MSTRPATARTAAGALGGTALGDGGGVATDADELVVLVVLWLDPPQPAIAIALTPTSVASARRVSMAAMLTTHGARGQASRLTA